MAADGQQEGPHELPAQAAPDDTATADPEAPKHSTSTAEEQLAPWELVAVVLLAIVVLVVGIWRLSMPAPRGPRIGLALAFLVGFVPLLAFVFFWPAGRRSTSVDKPVATHYRHRKFVQDRRLVQAMALGLAVLGLTAMLLIPASSGWFSERAYPSPQPPSGSPPGRPTPAPSTSAPLNLAPPVEPHRSGPAVAALGALQELLASDLLAAVPQEGIRATSDLPQFLLNKDAGPFSEKISGGPGELLVKEVSRVLGGQKTAKPPSPATVNEVCTNLRVGTAQRIAGGLQARLAALGARPLPDPEATASMMSATVVTNDFCRQIAAALSTTDVSKRPDQVQRSLEDPQSAFRKILGKIVKDIRGKVSTQPYPRLYTVLPGDSLWLIATRQLPPASTNAQINQAWRKIYAANRDIVGSNPDMLRPGQILHIPSSLTTSGTSRTSLVLPLVPVGFVLLAWLKRYRLPRSHSSMA